MMRFRPAMGWLHNWLGLLLGWLLFAIFVTGSFGYYRHEITLFMTPELRPLVGVEVRQEDAAQRGVVWLSTKAPGADGWTILLPDEKSPAMRVSWFGPDSGEAVLDPRTGEALSPAPRETGGGDFLYRLHSDLHFVPPIVGRVLVSLTGVALLVLLVTGLVTHRHILRNMFRLRRGNSWRTHLDLHNMTGVLGLPFHLFITLTGLVTVMMLIQPWGVASVYGVRGLGAFAQESFPAVAAMPQQRSGEPGMPALAPLIGEAKRVLHTNTVGEIDVEKPGTRDMRVSMAHPIRGIVQFRKPSVTFDPASGKILGTTNLELSSISLLHSRLFGLHVAHFAGPVVRLLLFSLGLVGSAMVATGVLLWTAKRWPNPAMEKPKRGVVIVDRLNAAVIAGLPIAIAAYLWANRSIPAHAASRASQEQNAMFIAWGLVLLAALSLPLRLVWSALFAVAASAMITLAASDMVGVGPVWILDAMFVALGAGFAFAAWRANLLPLRRRGNAG